jgi:hypothetical protein
MTKLVYITENGTRETDYNKVKGQNYTTEYEPIKEVETPEMREARLERIAKAQAGVAKAYAEYKKLMTMSE